MKLYEINKETIAVISLDNNRTKIIELNAEYEIESSSMKVMDYSCRYFGSSYDGRHKGTKNLIGVSHKSPIIVEESNLLIFFPTSSPRLDRCSWLNLYYVKEFYKHPRGTEVLFENGLKYIFDISHLSLQNQVLRATRLESVLRRRKELVN